MRVPFSKALLTIVGPAQAHVEYPNLASSSSVGNYTNIGPAYVSDRYEGGNFVPAVTIMMRCPPSLLLR